MGRFEAEHGSGTPTKDVLAARAAGEVGKLKDQRRSRAACRLSIRYGGKLRQEKSLPDGG
jgi:hypothetical protein